MACLSVPSATPRDLQILALPRSVHTIRSTISFLLVVCFVKCFSLARWNNECALSSFAVLCITSESLEARPCQVTMRQVTSTAFIAASSIISRTLALQVTPGSACASVCLDSAQGDTPLGTSDIVCDDSDYFSSEAGVKFKKCEECLQTSKAVNKSESDSSRFLCEHFLPWRNLLMPNLTSI